MIKKTLRLLLVALTVFAVSCTKEENVVPETEANLIEKKFGATQEDYKTSVDSKLRVIWQVGDQIAVHDGTAWRTSDALTEDDISNEGRKATFTVSVAAADSYYAVYPASSVNADVAPTDQSISVTIPDTQVMATGGTVAQGALVSVSKSTMDELNFKAATSLIKFEVGNDDINTIILEGNKNEGLAGSTTISSEGVPSTGSTTSIKVSGDLKNGSTYYLGVLPGTYSEGVHLTYVSSTGSAGVAYNYNPITLERRDGADFGKPTITKWLTYITTAAQLTAWAGSGDAIIGADIDMEGATWTPITTFSGTLNGAGHTIDNFVAGVSTYGACFIYKLSSGSIKNLTFGSKAVFTQGTSTTGLSSTTSDFIYAAPIIYINGSAVVDHVTNNAAVTYEANVRPGRASGIVGMTASGSTCTISNCVNNGAVSNSGAYSTKYTSNSATAGIVCRIRGGATITDCVNNGVIKATSSYSSFHTAGIIGYASEDNNTVTNCTNNAKVYVTKSLAGNSSGAYYPTIGGIIGNVNAATTVTDCVNNATVQLAAGPLSYSRYCIGGIIGRLDSSSASTVTGCSSTSTAQVSYNKVTAKSTPTFLGGIVGFYDSAASTVSNCDSYASISYSYNTKGATQILGGIAGVFNNGTLQNCTNYGTVTSNNSSSTAGAFYLGGIVGMTGSDGKLGKSGTTATEVEYNPHILNCTNEGTVSGAYGASLAAGGIIGLCASHVGTDEMTNCESKGSVTSANGAAGGLIGSCPTRSTVFETGAGCSVNCNISGSTAAGLAIGEGNPANQVTIGTEASKISLTEGNTVTVGSTVTTVSKSNYSSLLKGSGVSGVLVNTTWDEKVESLPAIWDFKNSYSDDGSFAKNGYIMNTADSPNPGTAKISAVKVASKGTLSYKVTTSADDDDYCSPMISGLYTDDYILYEMPTIDLKAGEMVNIMCNLIAFETTSPKYWICEFYDNGKWVAEEWDLRTTANGVKYSCYTPHTTALDQHATYFQSHVYEADTDLVKVRMRVVDNVSADGGTLGSSSGGIKLASRVYTHFYASRHSVPVKDTRTILTLGHSLCWKHGVYCLFKQICRDEGHQVNLRGHFFSNYQSDKYTKYPVVLDLMDNTGPYDEIILVDESSYMAKYAKNPTSYAAIKTNNMTEFARARTLSPSAKIYFEQTHSYYFTDDNKYRGFSSYANFDKLCLQGAQAMVAQDIANGNQCELLPVGGAFANARAAAETDSKMGVYENPEYTDVVEHHQNLKGAYLKACVVYMIVYDSDILNPQSVPGIDDATAAKLRDCARAACGIE